ncbi:hypothetical protein B0H14DRAFT_3872224 [Mycena olivaceomarginata]|nr:hypothetical protein B0H14DRAFT_3872224 [Mycena olivaceomarginata]
MLPEPYVIAPWRGSPWAQTWAAMLAPTTSLATADCEASPCGHATEGIQARQDVLCFDKHDAINTAHIIPPLSTLLELQIFMRATHDLSPSRIESIVAIASMLRFGRHRGSLSRVFKRWDKRFQLYGWYGNKPASLCLLAVQRPFNDTCAHRYRGHACHAQDARGTSRQIVANAGRRTA